MSLLGRADLLLALAALPKSGYTAMSRCLGYEIKPPSGQEKQPEKGKQPEGENESSAAADISFATIQPVYWYLSELQQQAFESEELRSLRPKEHDSQPEPWPEPLPDVNCWSSGQWQNLWDKLLRRLSPGRLIDLPKAVNHLAQQRTCDRLPFLDQSNSAQRVTLVFDMDPDLKPAFKLYQEAWQSVSVLIAKHSIQVFGIDANEQRWIDLLDEQRQAGSVADIASDAEVIVMGALGGLGSHKASAAWSTYLSSIKNAGNVLTVVALCQLELPAALGRVPVIPFETSVAGGKAFLLDIIASCWLLDEDCLWWLRAQRGLVSVEDILNCYNYSGMRSRSPYLCLSEHEATDRLAALKDSSDQALVQRIIKKLQPYLWRTEQQAGKLQRGLGCKDTIDIAVIPWLETIAAKIDGRDSEQPGVEDGVILSLLPLLRQYADKATDPRWRGLLNVAQKLAIAYHEKLPLTGLNLRSTHLTGGLVQRHSELVFVPDAGAKSCLLDLGNEGCCEQTRTLIGPDWTSISADAVILDNGQRYTFTAMEKPGWAENIHRAADGSIKASHANGSRFQLIPASANNPQSVWVCNSLGPWACAAGIDKQGLWADIEIAHKTSKSVRYRMRWIVPGTFTMGSPKTEKYRYQMGSLKGGVYTSKTFKHEVTLSQGYWLGETSVTRALWQSVTADSSTDKERSQLPITGVSWDECIAFIQRLNDQIEGIVMRLPSEAEWEYACRANTQTAFWWGDKFNPSFANDNNKLKIEENYPANPFGLKSMYGNNYEWCQDWYGEYPNGPVVDPRGPEKGQERVQRGGLSPFYRHSAREAQSPDNDFSIFTNASFRIIVSYGLRLAGGKDLPASPERGAIVTAARGEGAESQRAGLDHPT